MAGDEGNVDAGEAESAKIQRLREGKGEFLKTIRANEIDEEEEKELNTPSSESIIHIITDDDTSDDGKGLKEKRKGILKHERTYSNKHVDFNMDIEIVPFDESKDYTIEIQIVEKMPKKVVSYAALIAQQKALEEEEKKKKEQKEKRVKTIDTKPDCSKCKIKKTQKEKPDDSPNKCSNANEKIDNAKLAITKNNNSTETESNNSTIDTKTVDTLQQPLSDLNRETFPPGPDKIDQSVENVVSIEDLVEECNCTLDKEQCQPQECTLCESSITNDELNTEKKADATEKINMTDVSCSNNNEGREIVSELDLQNIIIDESNIDDQKEISTQLATEQVQNPEEKNNEEQGKTSVIQEEINNEQCPVILINEEKWNEDQKEITNDKCENDKCENDKSYESDVPENSDQDDFFESFDNSESISIKNSHHENSNISNSSSFSEDLKDDAACNVKCESLTETNATENDDISSNSLSEDAQLTEDANDVVDLSVNSIEGSENIPRSISPGTHDFAEKITEDLDKSTDEISTSDILSASSQSIAILDRASSIPSLEKENEIKSQLEINEFEKGDFHIQNELKSNTNSKQFNSEEAAGQSNVDNFSEPITLVDTVKCEIRKDVLPSINATTIEGQNENFEINDSR